MVSKSVGSNLNQISITACRLAQQYITATDMDALSLCDGRYIPHLRVESLLEDQPGIRLSALTRIESTLAVSLSPASLPSGSPGLTDLFFKPMDTFKSVHNCM